MKTLLIILLLVSGCGVVEHKDEAHIFVDHVYSARVKNLNKVMLDCFSIVNGETEEFETEEVEILIYPDKPNSFVYLSCEKQGDTLDGITAELYIDGELESRNSCNRYFCKVLIFGGGE